MWRGCVVLNLSRSREIVMVSHSTSYISSWNSSVLFVSLKWVWRNAILYIIYFYQHLFEYAWSYDFEHTTNNLWVGKSFSDSIINLLATSSLKDTIPSRADWEAGSGGGLLPGLLGRTESSSADKVSRLFLVSNTRLFLPSFNNCSSSSHSQLASQFGDNAVDSESRGSTRPRS